jgi:hypothetical protein
MGGWIIFWILFLITAITVIDMGRSEGRRR